jgi:carbonic anhydrase
VRQEDEAMKNSELLLKQNKEWAAERLKQDPAYFDRLAAGQKPKTLWIGCSDSRVPANEITGTHSGEIFVHRNIANVVVHTDLNLSSVLQYAVEVLEVEDVIVCGHYGCGGVLAAMTNKSFGLINKWLRNIKDVYHEHQTELDGIADQKARERRLVELHVVAQMQNLAKATTVQTAWNKHKRPWLHAWVYGMDDGILKEMGKMGPDITQIDPIYRMDV